MKSRHLLFRALLAPTIACSISTAVLAQGALDQRQYVEHVLRAGLDARVAEAEAAVGMAEAVGAGAWSNPVLGWQRESAAGGQGTRATQDIFSVSLPLVL